MAVINSSTELVLSRGRLFLAPCPPVADGGIFAATEFLFIGNVPDFSVNVETETLDHYRSTGGIREQDDSTEIKVDRSATITTDNIDPENLARFFLGETTQITQLAATVTDEAHSVSKLGVYIQLGKSVDNIAGNRGVENVVVTDVATGTVLVENEDYLVQPQAGLVEILETGTVIQPGSDVTITYDIAAQTRDRVISGNEPVEGALQYIEDNPTGDDKIYLFPYVKVRPNGDFNFITDDWQTIPFDIEVLTLDGQAAILVDGQPAV